MALVPLLRTPCPVRFDRMPQPGMDYCTLCARRVHNLDGLTDAQRRAVLATADADGRVCVAYTLRRPAQANALVRTAAAAALVATGCASATQPAPHDQVIPTHAATAAAAELSPVPAALDEIVVLGSASPVFVDDSQVDLPEGTPDTEVPPLSWSLPPDAEDPPP